MSSLGIWVFAPGAAAVALYAFRRWNQAATLAGTIIALLLAWLAWLLPIEQPIPIRLWAGIPALRIQAAQLLFGSRFVLDNSARPALALLFFSAAFWFGGSLAANTHRLFVPLGLGVAALTAAALAADSVPAAALLISLAALVGLPIVSPPGAPARRGALRFLVYIISGTCLVLFADAAISNLLGGAAADAAPDLTPAVLMLALGFALILAVTPFHTWMPMLGEETNPYAAAFIFFLLPIAVSFLAFEALLGYSIAGLTPVMFQVLRSAGALMVIAGGVGAAFERHLGRILGFGAVAMMGMTLLAISLNDQLGRPTPMIGIFFAQLPPTGLALALWSLALCILRLKRGGLDFVDIRGAGRELPLTAAAIALANLSLAGLPLLAGFPVALALWSALARTSVPTALISAVGLGGLAAAALRSLAALITGEEPAPWQIGENRMQFALLTCGALLLFIAGSFPQIYLPTLTNLGIIFAGPAP